MTATLSAPQAARPLSHPSPQQAEPSDLYFSREAFHELIRLGFLEGKRVELIRGRLIQMPAMSDQHGMSSLKGGKRLRVIFPEDRYTVRPGLPFIAANDSEPEPDLCVVTGPVEANPTHPDRCLLLIEVALATLRYDRTSKAAIYAESGVEDYWIVNLIDRVVEVYRRPHRIADGSWSYDAPTVRRAGETLDLLAMPGASIAVDDLLP